MFIATLAPAAALVASRQIGKPGTTPQAGALVSREACAAHPDQTYALYLPSTYTTAKKWPIVYAFDPAARGNLPVERMKAAAEHDGYIVVGSNNSRNGSWTLESEATRAMYEDTHERFSVDDGRMYFAGLSGGARVAAQVAQRCKCAAGILLNGAGFPIGSLPSQDAVFAVFAVVGDFDFNYPEVTQLDDKLEASGFPHLLRHFDGPHEWAPAAIMDEGFRWFRLMAMKQNREPRDDDFIAAQQVAATARAQGFEQSGDWFAAWREYRQSAATFDGLADTTALRRAESGLVSQKSVRDGAKREKQDFDQQDQLTADISGRLNALRQDATTFSDSLRVTQQKIADLRERSAGEKHAERARVLHRALASVMVEAMESGDERLEARDFSVAAAYFQLAAEADPHSAWALGSLATARAQTNDRKGTLEALRKTKAITNDPAAFSAWLQTEPVFAKLRGDPQFRALIETQ
jgi:hypothetical protein